MQGALEIPSKGKADKSFVADMAIPDGKLANTIAFLKFVNLIRSGNMNVWKDSIKDVSKHVADIKHIITVNNVAACVGFKAVVAFQKSSHIQYPKVEECWKYPAWKCWEIRMA